MTTRPEDSGADSSTNETTEVAEEARATVGQMLGLVGALNGEPVPDAEMSEVAALRDEIARLIDALDRADLRKPFLRVDAAVRYGLRGGSVKGCLRALTVLESNLERIARGDSEGRPLLPIAASARPAPSRAPEPIVGAGTEGPTPVHGTPVHERSTPVSTPRSDALPDLRDHPDADGAMAAAEALTRSGEIARLARPAMGPPTRGRRTPTRPPEPPDPGDVPPDGADEDVGDADDLLITVDTSALEEDEERERDEMAATMVSGESAALTDAPTPAIGTPSPDVDTAQDDSGENRLSFETISSDVHEVPDLSALTTSDEQRRVDRESSPGLFAGFATDSSPTVEQLKWLGSDELEELDRELERVMEPSGLHDVEDRDARPDEDAQRREQERPEPPDGTQHTDAPAADAAARQKGEISTGPRTESGLLPVESFGGFEDSGLFVVFVDDSELDEDSGLISLEIDVAPPETMSGAELAYRGFVEHIHGILERLCDSLELALLGREATELLDVHQQLNRLARVLDFVELDRQLSLIVYIQTLLPLRYADWDGPFLVGQPKLMVSRARLPQFQGLLGELLNCMTYLFGYLAHEIPDLARGTFERVLLDLYEGLTILPGDPSDAAPVGPYGHADGLKLTSRTRALMGRAVKSRVTEALDHLESAMLHGRVGGYPAAASTLALLAHVFESYEVPDAPEQLVSIVESLRTLPPLAKPGRDFVAQLSETVEGLAEILPNLQPDPLIDRARTLVDRVSFSERISTDQNRALRPEEDAFSAAWRQFRTEATHHLDALLGLAPGDQLDSLPPVRDTVRELRELAQNYDIDLLDRLLGTLQEHWERAPHACAHVLEDLAASIRALPASGASYAQLEALARSIVSDLVQRRSSQPTGVARVSEEVGATTVKLVTDIGKLLETVCDDPPRRSTPHRRTLRARARELAETAREHKHIALGLGCEVVAEILAIEPEPEDFEAFDAALHDAREVLVRVLDNAVETLDEQGPRRQRADTNFWFAHWLEQDDPERENIEIRRSVRERIETATSLVTSVWESVGSSAVLNAPQLEQYHRGIDALRRIATWLQLTEVQADLAAHHVELTTIESRRDLDVAHEEWNKIAAALQSATPSVHQLSLGESGRRFVGAIQRSVRELERGLDAADRGREPPDWRRHTRAALDALVPVARASLVVPFLGIVCELRSVLVSSSGVRATEVPDRLLLLLQWIERLVLATCPRPEHDESSPFVTVEAAPRTGRVLLGPLVGLAHQSAALGDEIEEIRALINAGPLTFASKAGRDALERLSETVDEVESALDGLLPARISSRLEALAHRAEHRARLLGRVVEVEAHVSGIDDVARLDELTGEALVTVLAGLETVTEGLIDASVHALAQDHAPSIRLDVDARTSAIDAYVDHDVPTLSTEAIETALAATDFGEPDGAGPSLVGALASTPASLAALPGANGLVLADALLTRAGGRLSLERVGQWHRIALCWDTAESVTQ